MTVMMEMGPIIVLVKIPPTSRLVVVDCISFNV